MRGKQLLGTALGQNNLPVGDLRLTMTNGTGQIRTDDDAHAGKFKYVFDDQTIRVKLRVSKKLRVKLSVKLRVKLRVLKII